MNVQTDRNASTQTFGPRPSTPSPVRAKSTRRVEDTLQVQPERPGLSRVNTPVPPEQLKDVAALYDSGLFADPPKQKSWKFGVIQYTEAHTHLISMLRGECVRLHGYSKQLKGKLFHTERQLRMTQESLAEARSIAHSRKERIDDLTDDLRDAQESLAEMDSMLSETRRKRLNRLSGIAPGSSAVLENAL